MKKFQYRVQTAIKLRPLYAGHVYVGMYTSEQILTQQISFFFFFFFSLSVFRCYTAVVREKNLRRNLFDFDRVSMWYLANFALFHIYIGVRIGAYN